MGTDTFVMTDCHDWFAEVAETLVRYLVAKAGFEVFGQSEWGADLAIRDAATGRWLRCEVRSSDTKPVPGRKDCEKLSDSAELLANVTLTGPTHFKVLFYKLNNRGQKVIESLGGPPIAHEYQTPETLADWLRGRVLEAQGREYPVKLVRTDEGYSVWCPSLPGCWSQGGTEDEALNNIKDAIAEYLAEGDADLLHAETRTVEVM